MIGRAFLAVGFSLMVAGCTTREASFLDSMNEREHAKQTESIGGIDDPDQSLIKIAEYFRDHGERQTAIALYQRALKNSESSETTLDIARSLMALNAFADAVSAYRRAIADDSDDHEARLGLGLALLQSGQIEQSISYFRQLTSMPEHFTIRSCRFYGAALDLHADHAEAQAIYERCLKLAPDDTGVRSNLALSQVLSGRKQAAVATSVDVIQGPGASSVHVRNHVLVLALAGRSAEAERLGKGSLGEADMARIIETARRIVAIEDPAERARSIGLMFDQTDR